GSIGFIGLIAPHIARRFVGPVHKWLIPASAVTGAIMLIAADLTARTLVPPVELPVGAVTALIGAPYFLYKISKHGLRSL
ncbi:MAG TPA: iron chelate uptake ABC transporter family permease subunit, partial [Spirochaetia bacterium]|nr:iron chelate uptake ABC transporter family permease subunit [Spirochaetia bacterium]